MVAKVATMVLKVNTMVTIVATMVAALVATLVAKVATMVANFVYCTPDCLIWMTERIPAMRHKMEATTEVTNDHDRPSIFDAKTTNPIIMKTTEKEKC